MRAIAVLALGAVTFGTLAAQEDPGARAAFKLRGGIQAASRKDGLNGPVMGFGLEVALPLGNGHLTLEPGYLFKNGKQFLSDPGALPRAASGITVDPDYSVDSTKNKLEGAFLRVGYRAGISGAWAWQAGLQLGGAKFTNQYLGLVTDGQIDTSGNLQNASYLDTYTGIASKAVLAVSPFAGVTWNVDDSSSFEFGIVVLGYKAIRYTHVVGSEIADPSDPDQHYVWGGHTTKDTLVENNRMIPHVEISYVYHF